MRSLAALALSLLLAACGSSSSDDAAALPNDDTRAPTADASPSVPATDPDAGGDAAAPPPTCISDTAPASLGKATAAGEYTLVVEAASTSHTSWAQKGNEAVVLEVLRAGNKRVSHIVLHQGATKFSYGIHVGALAAGEELTVKVSPLTAANATKGACFSKIALAPVGGADAEGILNAPILKWPKGKSFDDLPVLIGWSRSGKSYQMTYTNENGGTVAICGGGAKGMRSEIARWGRGLDMEQGYTYGGGSSFERCPGAGGSAKARLEGAHPVLYYGDGHNRLYESRGGYGQACGTGSDVRADGDLLGWNASNPGNEADKDDPYVIVVRPLPVDLDALGFAKYGGRREGQIDTYAPWLYRIVDSELSREGKIDNVNTFSMSHYLFVDVYAADVDGSGDATCGGIFGGVSGGFVLRAKTAGGAVYDGPQMTADYFGSQTPGVKRLAIPLTGTVHAADITSLVFDAYDKDGIYILAIGDAFIPQPDGDNGAKLEYAVKGQKAVGAYVDDDDSGCVNGKNTNSGIEYPCVQDAIAIPVP